ncbi:nuclease HARBI1-like protein [Aphelenchoides avenae]|nr:nuclease HARBI1-like protein [Aphelenchus avenae]KAH7705184.1 nuclease HARBI1-like protein [Aphelenchus avenae]
MSYAALAQSFRLGGSTVHNVVKETTEAIYDCLRDTYLRTPRSEEEWLRVAQDFELQWQVPHALGCIDGKHVKIVAPAKSGSTYYNYKDSFSIVLMGLCDANYRLLYVDVGSYGHNSDGGIYDSSSLKAKLDSGALNLPAPRPLPGQQYRLPYFFIGDGAFALTENMMKPFPEGANYTRRKRIYNYRLCRARRIIENVFGIMAMKWRVLLTTIGANPANAQRIVEAVCVLHNFLIAETPRGPTNPLSAVDSDDNDDNGIWRAEVPALSQARMRNRNNNRPTDAAIAQRDYLVDYFNGIGAVNWQDGAIGETE